jgi:hypothetical protein
LLSLTLIPSPRVPVYWEEKEDGTVTVHLWEEPVLYFGLVRIA